MAQHKKNSQKLTETKRVTISIRNVDQEQWRTVQDLASRRGVKTWLAFEQMCTDWIKKNETQ